MNEKQKKYLKWLGYNDYEIETCKEEDVIKSNQYESFMAGYEIATKNAPKWHKIFVDSEPYNYEYWECPQETLPKKQDFYFVRLKNGFVKICELKSDILGRRKIFYNLHGGAQSNVAEWLEYPDIQDVKE